MQNIYNMKTFFSNPSLLLLSSIAVNNGFYKPAFIPQINIFDRNFISTKNTDNPLNYKRRKSIEDLVVDGFIDSTKKLLSLEDTECDNTNKKRRSIKSFQPKTKNQNTFLELMRNDEVDIVIAIGPAGTGKTMLACYAAVEALRLGKIKKIVVTRPVVSVDEEIGFLPGGIESKMDPWTRPIFDTLQETYSAKEIEKMTEDGIIEIVPLGFMRGRTFKNAWIIADEMQNSSPTQMFMLATRIGEGSKMIITGDLNQSDLNTKSNGLLEIYNKIRHSEKKIGVGYVRYIELEAEDVQRSRAAKLMLDIWNCSESHSHEYLTHNNHHIYIPYNNNSSPVNDTFTNDDKSSPVNIENNSISLSPSQHHINKDVNKETKKETEQIDNKIDNNDAALIPIKHINQLKKYL